MIARPLTALLSVVLTFTLAFVTVPRCDSFGDLLSFVSELTEIGDSESFNCHSNDHKTPIASSSDRFSEFGCQCAVYVYSLALPGPIVKTDDYLLDDSIAMIDNHSKLITWVSTPEEQDLRPPIFS